MIVDKLKCALSRRYPKSSSKSDFLWMAMFFNSFIFEFEDTATSMSGKIRKHRIPTMVVGKESDYIKTYLQKQGYKPTFRDEP